MFCVKGISYFSCFVMIFGVLWKKRPTFFSKAFFVRKFIEERYRWNVNTAGVNHNLKHANQIVLYCVFFQTAPGRKHEIVRNKACVARANGTDAFSMKTDAFSMKTDARSMGTANTVSARENEHPDFEVTCKACKMKRLVDSVNGKVKIVKCGSKYVLISRSYKRFHCQHCNKLKLAESIEKINTVQFF